jgi:hypothetical protein
VAFPGSMLLGLAWLLRVTADRDGGGLETAH